MPFFVVTFTHHDKELHAVHLASHIDWLKEMVERDCLRLSGPLFNGPLAHAAPGAALLILKFETKGAVMEAIATDPFYIHGVTDGVTVTEWNPIFGRFADESSGVSSLTASR